MTPDEIRELFLAEHRRDKKLTLINFALIGLAILAFLVLMAVFLKGKLLPMANGFFTSPDTHPYIKLVLPAMFLLTWVVWPWIKLHKISKRESRIETVLAHMRAGTPADHVTQETVYKVVVPLGKIITFHLFPVEILHFSYGAETFGLPVPVRHISDIKRRLSGSDMEKITAVWDELYNNGSPTMSTASTPLKPMEEFMRFADRELKSTLEAMEKGRKKSSALYIGMAALIVLGMGGFIGYNFLFTAGQTQNLPQNTDTENIETYNQNMGNHTYTLLFVVLGLAVTGYAYHLYARHKTKGVAINPGAADFTRFKQTILKKILAFANPTFEYVQHGHIGLGELLETGLFDEKYYNLNGNDLIVGKHSGVPFQYCDLSVHRQKTVSNQNEGPEEVFLGQYFVARFPKSFAAPVYLTAKTGIKDILLTGNDIKGYLRLPAGKVELEDPEFMKLFNVHCDDQVAARYVLTPALMQRIKDIALRHKNNRLYIVIKDRKITVANNNRQNKFETGLFTKLTPELLGELYGDLCAQFAMIDDLKLNINIWQK